MGQGRQFPAINTVVIGEGPDMHGHHEIRVARHEAAIAHGRAFDDRLFKFVQNLLRLRHQFDRDMDDDAISQPRSEEHTSELQSLMRISYAVFCLKKKKQQKINKSNTNNTK